MHLSELIITFGYIGVFLAVFAESGFFLGFFLPGDSLLVTLGVLSATQQGDAHFNIWTLVAICVVAAILGDSFGYWMGKTFGKGLFKKVNTRFLKPEYLDKTEEFFNKYGKKTIILSRFVPIVRTFAPIFAGIAEMKYVTFLSFNIIGGIIWAGGLLLVSHYVSIKIPQVNDYLEYVILGIIALSVLPPVIEYLRHRSKKR